MRIAPFALAAGCGATAIVSPAIDPPALQPPTIAPANRETLGTPCFPERAALKASEIMQKLVSYGGYREDGEEKWLPAIKYGRCTVDRGQVIEADGSLVAEISCGLRVVRTGITDDNGVQIGSLGVDLLEHRARNPAWAKLSSRCVSNGPHQVRCVFQHPDYQDRHSNGYVVAGDLGDHDVLLDDAALAFFRPRVILELFENNSCH